MVVNFLQDKVKSVRIKVESKFKIFEVLQIEPLSMKNLKFKLNLNPHTLKIYSCIL